MVVVTLQASLAVSAALGSATEPAKALVSRLVVEQIRKGEKDIQGLCVRLQPLLEKLSAVRSASELTKLVAESESLAAGLDRLIAAEIADGKRLMLGPKGLVERLSHNGASLSRTAMREVTTQLKRLGDEEAKFIAELLAPQGLQELIGQVDVELPAALRDVVIKLRTGDVLPTAQELRQAAGAVMDSVGLRLGDEIDHLTKAVDDVNGLIIQIKELPGGMPASRSDLKAYANVLQTAAVLLGNQEVAKEVAKAAGYAESAFALYDSYKGLLLAGSGWGAALAVSGIVGGTGGLGLFGPSGPSSGNAAVLEAIQALSERIDRHFERVNEKLLTIHRTVSEILELLGSVDAKADLLLEDLRVANQKLDRLLLAEDTSTRVLAEVIYEERFDTCRAAWVSAVLPAGPATLVDCYSFYGERVPKSSALPPFQTAWQDPWAALRLDFSAGASPSAMWSRAAAFKALLAEYGYQPPNGAPRHWPVLAQALDGMMRLNDAFKDNPGLSNEALGMLDQQVVGLRQAMQEHEQFVNWLRGPAPAQMQAREHPILKPLLARLDGCVHTLEQAWQALVRVGAYRVIKRIEQGALSFGATTFERAPSIRFVNTDGLGHTWDVYSPKRVADGEIGWLCTTYIPEAKHLPAVLELVHVSHSRTRRPLTTTEDVEMKFLIKMYDDVVSTESMQLLLRFDRGAYKDPPPVAKDAAHYVGSADGAKLLAGSQVITERLRNWLSANGPMVEEVQTHRIFNNQLLLLEAAALTLLDNTPGALGGAEELFRTALKSMEETALLIRAVCRFGFEDSYALHDELVSMLEGGLDHGLVIQSFLEPWAQAVASVVPSKKELDPKDSRHRMAFLIQSGVPEPKDVEDLATLARKRVAKLQRLLDELLARQVDFGENLAVVALRSRFARTFGTAEDNLLGLQ